jgi:TolB-like protein
MMASDSGEQLFCILLLKILNLSVNQKIFIMGSLIEGFNYDIFISYRQKDNKYDGWVTEFVDNLRKELEATFKEEVSVYFDINPHDGLLETHDVDASLKEKLNCLIFIPIISRTYCDPKSFAWEHEFKVFIEKAAKDQFGLKVKLPCGNTAGRVLPVKINNLDKRDLSEYETISGGVLRGIEFIYRSAGVNRPLRSKEDNPGDNLNRTYYRDQINKVANSIKDIISGVMNESAGFEDETIGPIPDYGKSVSSEKSIIVLPFENISPDHDQEYFSDGLTEEIITDLSHIHDILVISRSSAMTFKGTKKKISDIAREVNVHYVLEGSVRKAGNNLRISAQLIDGTNDSHIWAEKYSGILDDIFDIQEKVSSSIVNELKLRLSPEEKVRVAERQIKNIQSYEYYLKAKQEIYHYTDSSINKAIGYLVKAIDIEGENSSLYAELAHAYYQFWNIGIKNEEDILIKANEYVRKAFEIDPESLDGQFVSGLLEATGGDVRNSFHLFRKVLKKSPNHANALAWITIPYATLGFTEPTGQQIKRLSQIDPFSPLVMVCTIFLSIFTGDFKNAEKQSSHLGSDDYSTLFKIRALLYNGAYNEAFKLYSLISLNAQSSFLYRCVFMQVCACLNLTDEIEKVKDDKIVLWAKKDYAYSLYFAEIYAMLNETDIAMDWLENAIMRGNINYPFISRFDPLLENLRCHSRFIELMERLKYEWASFTPFRSA